MNSNLSDVSKGLQMESIESALRFLSTQFAQVEDSHQEWEREKKELQQKIIDLQQVQRVQDQMHRDMLLQIKMLSYAVKNERVKYFLTKTIGDTETQLGVSADKLTRTTKMPYTNDSPASRPDPRLHTVRTSRPTKSNADTLAQSGDMTEMTEDHSMKKPIPKKKVLMEQDTIHTSIKTSSTAESSMSIKVEDHLAISEQQSSVLCPQRLKVKLSGHMGGVRCVSFHSDEPILVSAGEDCAVRIWNLSKNEQGPPTKRSMEVEPMRTFRGHTDAILSVAIVKASAASPQFEDVPNGICASGGKDGRIVLWRLPTAKDAQEPLTYEEHQQSKVDMFDAHEDAIWDLCAHPLTNLMLSCSADASVRLWEVSEAHNVDGFLIPTSICIQHTDVKKCVVGYTSAALVEYDLDRASIIQVMAFKNHSSRSAQVNKVISHPTMPIMVAAHQDNSIRLYDVRTGKCEYSMTAHQRPVSSISLDNSGVYLASGGHDGSLRFWSMSNQKCIHEQAVHRHKYAEAVYSVTHHLSLGLVATGGADSLIKIFQ